MAEVCVASGFPPEVFGVPSSVELGEEIIGVLAERAKSAKEASLLSRLRGGR